MLVDVDASGLAEEVDIGNPATSSTPGQPEETQRHSRPPSSRVSNHVELQLSTQTSADELNLLAPLSDPHPEAGPPIELAAPQSRDARKGRRGLPGRNASLLTFSKKKGALETLRRNCAVKDGEATGDAEEVLELLESTSVTGSRVFHSGASIEASLQDGDATATAAKQTSRDGTESHSLAEYEEQNLPSPPSPNIE